MTHLPCSTVLVVREKRDKVQWFLLVGDRKGIRPQKLCTNSDSPLFNTGYKRVSCYSNSKHLKTTNEILETAASLLNLKALNCESTRCVKKQKKMKISHKTRMALSRALTSAKVQQSSLIQSTHIQNQTRSRVTIIPQNVTVTWGTTWPQLTLTVTLPNPVM